MEGYTIVFVEVPIRDNSVIVTSQSIMWRLMRFMSKTLQGE